MSFEDFIRHWTITNNDAIFKERPMKKPKDEIYYLNLISIDNKYKKTILEVE